jgi:hypothetical protein
MKGNKYVQAVQAMNTLINKALAGTRDIEAIRKELLQKSKEELVDLLIVHMKAENVTVESVAKVLLESEECAYLTYNEIAAGIATRLNSQTSDKSIASYASKNPKIKGWKVVPRKSNAERNAEITKLANLKQL